MSKASILFVDDQVSLLNAMARHFNEHFDVHIAEGGEEGIRQLHSQGPFSVIVSDMQMPGMNGVEFLQKAREICPDTVRIMLTSNDDQSTAVEAVNRGEVFRFLNKPCQADTLMQTLMQAIKQYELVTAEKELLNGTLKGSMKLLTDVLSMVASKSFGRAMILQEYARILADDMQLEKGWELELAAMFSVVAYVTVPSDTLQRLSKGESLTSSEQTILTQLPESASKLLENIPRMESVRRILYYHQKHFDGKGFPDDGVAGEGLPIESRLLKIITDIVRLEAAGLSLDDIFVKMRERSGWYDPNLLMGAEASFAEAREKEAASTPKGVSVVALRPGQRLLSNIETENGLLLYHAGNIVTEAIIERLSNYMAVTGIKEPIEVIDPPSDGNAEVVFEEIGDGLELGVQESG